MRILHLITRMDGGGSAATALLIAIKQAKAGHHVKLVFGQGSGSDMSDAEGDKVNKGLQALRDLGGFVEIVPYLKRQLTWADKAAVGQLKILLLQAFDVLHTHTSKAGALGRLAAKGMAVQVIHMPHGHVFYGYFGMFKTWVYLQVERYLAKHTDVLIAVTKAERDDHLQLGVGKPEQWRVVPSGVDVEAISDWIWEHPVAPQNQCWDVVSVGRLTAIKGMARLIQAWALVVVEHPEARLALVGDGEERQNLEQLASRLGIAEQVFFAGWADPVVYLAKAKAFALLSHNEGMGRAVVEAMAAGLPCVVSDVCGLKELVDESVGCCLDASDAEAVAQALLTTWSDDIRHNARKRAAAYSIASMMQGLDTIYGEVRLTATV